jgi:hypothetical protein
MKNVTIVGQNYKYRRIIILDTELNVYFLKDYVFSVLSTFVIASKLFSTTLVMAAPTNKKGLVKNPNLEQSDESE